MTLDTRTAPRVVARLTGPLPEGGFEEGTPIWTCDAPGLLLPTGAPRPCRTDIPLGDLLAFQIEDVVTRAEAARFIALTEALAIAMPRRGSTRLPGCGATRRCTGSPPPRRWPSFTVASRGICRKCWKAAPCRHASASG